MLDVRKALSEMVFRQVKFGAGHCIEVTCTEDALAIALQQAEKVGELNQSILKGEGNQAGFLGEMMVAAYSGAYPSWVLSNVPSYNHDIIVPHPIFGNIKEEVKTKQTSVAPKPYYDASVAAYNTTQKCDYYVFTRILTEKTIIKQREVRKPLNRGWILGYMPPYDYYKMARSLKKGEIDPSNGFEVLEDFYNVAYSELFYLPARFDDVAA